MVVGLMSTVELKLLEGNKWFSRLSSQRLYVGQIKLSRDAKRPAFRLYAKTKVQIS